VVLSLTFMASPAHAARVAVLLSSKVNEYQEALKLRVPVSTIDLVIIEGYEGPQPS